MKHLFIVNPAAGKGKGHEALVERIIEVTNKLATDVNVYVTKEINDGFFYVKDFLERLPKGSELRIYSCGGDGTLNEVVNGMLDFRSSHRVSVGCIPTGTGNDFVRNFQDVDFTDIIDQMGGTTKKVDLISFQYNDGNDEVLRHCINMFNIGFDCEVVYRTSILKKYPLLHGSLAYLVGILLTLIKKEGTSLEIKVEDETIHQGKLLLASIGNGSYCGGGLKGLPKAKVDDGLMDVSIVQNVPRRTFISLFPHYSKGTHLGAPGIEEIVTYRQCKSMVIQPNGEHIRLCTDGEICEAGPIRFNVEPLALDFIIPASLIG